MIIKFLLVTGFLLLMTEASISAKTETHRIKAPVKKSGTAGSQAQTNDANKNGDGQPVENSESSANADPKAEALPTTYQTPRNNITDMQKSLDH